MSMTFKVREVGGVTIVDLSGKITMGDGSPTLREEVHKLLDEGKKKIVLNLADVNYIDSSGLGELVSSYTSVKNSGGELKLLNLTSRVRDLLVITKLVTVFEVKDDEVSAVSSFA